MSELELEKSKLSTTIQILKEVIKEENEDLEDIYNSYSTNMELLLKIANQKKNHIKNLENSLEKPYFARIDFNNENQNNIIYIGKNGVIKDNNIIVTDWRAPISSLYYDSEIGRCSYESPEGIISGTMELKRQYEIEKGKLINYFNVDLVSNDLLLQKYLNSNNDTRLKSIVSTIQKDQNKVIRKKLNENLIIQGVAGSGKTTVALHRLAYLVYNYINTIKQDQYLVIGPNPVFIKYIRSVLPDLDVSEVKQCTFEEFAQNYIEEKININSSDNKINNSISKKIINDIDKFKCSNKYQKMIEKFLNEYFKSLTNKDLKLGDYVILKSNLITNEFNKLDNMNLNDKVNRLIDILCKIIKERYDLILKNYNMYSWNLFDQAKDIEEQKELRKIFTKEKEELKKYCRNTIRKYFSNSKISVTKLYKLFISSINEYNIYEYKYIEQLQKDTLKNIRNTTYDFEDLSALIYIKNSLSPIKYYENIKHVVVDEAQDLGEFNFSALKKALPASTFSIFGDLAQSIYDYRSIDDWEQVNEIMFNNNGEVINFTKSYRTTAEIMNVANIVASSIGLKLADLVVRHGNPVSFNKVEKDNIVDYIISKINEYKNKGYKTIAVISKDDISSININEKLFEKGLYIPNVNIDDDLNSEKFKICTISNYMAKGLEFDAVIINGVDEENYCSNNKLDMKLLYVAITRALHEVDIIHSNEITNVLKK